VSDARDTGDTRDAVYTGVVSVVNGSENYGMVII